MLSISQRLAHLARSPTAFAPARAAHADASLSAKSRRSSKSRDWCRGFLVLLTTISTPPAFVGATAAMAAASILVTAKDHKVRSLGNFTFIPALYLACEA